jgi:MarR family transcriptional regulator, organic hydroperoxide resistance regulator
MSKSSFEFEKPEQSPGFLLWQTTITWQRLIKKALEPYKISHAQFVIMAILLWFKKCNNQATQSILINWSKLDKMTVSKSLKKLVSQKLVAREENETDTRSKKTNLTHQGKNLIRQLVPIIEQIDANFFSVIPHDNQRSLMNILSILVENNND